MLIAIAEGLAVIVGCGMVLIWRMAGTPMFGALRRMDQSREELRQTIEHDVRYANITIIEGNQASEFGIGMVSARIAEAVLRDERVVIPIGFLQPGVWCYAFHAERTRAGRRRADPGARYVRRRTASRGAQR